MRYSRLLKLLQKPPLRMRIQILVLIAFMLVGSMFLVVLTGGIPSAFAHTMYVPVLISALVFGVKPTVIIAIMAGVLVGPVVSVHPWSESGESFVDSLYRSLYFVGIGTVAAFLFNRLKDHIGRIDHIRTHDPLTGLPNEQSLFDKSTTESSEETVTLTVEAEMLEELKPSLGHESYAKVLRMIHGGLREHLPPEALVALVDQRKFWVVMGASVYEEVKSSFLEALDDLMVEVDDIPLHLDFVVGESHQDHTLSLEERFKKSDLAAIHARRHDMKHLPYQQKHEFEQHRFRRLGLLPKALEEGELHLVYQPIIRLDTRECVALEALIRWHHEDKIIMPAEFIPLAEKTRLIHRITSYVAERIIEDRKTVKRRAPDLRFTMNISQRDLYNLHFTDNITQKVDAAGLRAETLSVEVTETALMANRKIAKSILEGLRARGMGVWLDDFGMKHSSLSLLKDLPVDIVKIDKVFTQNAVQDADVRILISSILTMAKQLRMEVVCEGIEDKEMLDLLEAMGCDYGQGYHIARPMNMKSIVKWLDEFQEPDS